MLNITIYVEIHKGFIMADKIGELFVEIKGDVTQLNKTVQGLKASGEKDAKSISDSFKKHKIDMDTHFATMKMGELKKNYEILKTLMAKKLELNASTASIEKTAIALDSVRNRIKQLNSDVKNTGTEGEKATGFLSHGFGKVIASIGGLFALERIGDFLKDITLEAAKFEEISSFFKGSAQDMELFRAATKGTVSDMNLMRLSNQAGDLGVQLKEQPLLFAMAKRAAEAYGTSTEEGFAKVVMATEGNIRGLRAVGVQKVVYEQIVKSLAKAHGGLITEMDAETAKQIRMDALIKASGMTMEEATNKARSHADQIEGAGVAWDNLKISMGKVFGLPVATFFNAIAEGLKGWKEFLSSSQKTPSKEFDQTYYISIKDMSKYELAMEKERLHTEVMKRSAIMATTGIMSDEYKLAAAEGRALQKQLEITKDINKYKSQEKVGKDTGGLTPEALVARKDKAAAEAKTILDANKQLAYALSDQTTAQINDEFAQKEKSILEKLALDKQYANDTITNKKVLASTLKTLGVTADTALFNLNKDFQEKLKKNAEDLEKSKADVLSKSIQEQISIEKSTYEYKIRNYQLSEKEYADYLERMLQLEIKAAKLSNAKTANDNCANNTNNPLIDIAAYTSDKTGDNTNKVSNYGSDKKDATAKTWEENNKLMAQATHESLGIINGEWSSSLSSWISGGQSFAAATAHTWTNMANQIIEQILRIGTQYALLQGAIEIFGAASGGFGGFLIKVLGGAKGGDFMGTPNGVVKMAGGGSFTVPQGYQNDSYPMFVQSGEKVSVTPAGKTSDNERLMTSMMQRLDVMNLNLIQNSAQKNKDLNVNVNGQIGNEAIYLSNKKETKRITRSR